MKSKQTRASRINILKVKTKVLKETDVSLFIICVDIVDSALM